MKGSVMHFKTLKSAIKIWKAVSEKICYSRIQTCHRAFLDFLSLSRSRLPMQQPLASNSFGDCCCYFGPSQQLKIGCSCHCWQLVSEVACSTFPCGDGSTTGSDLDRKDNTLSGLAAIHTMTVDRKAVRHSSHRMESWKFEEQKLEKVG